MNLSGKTVLVFGAAKSGIASAHFLVKKGALVYLNDLKKREDFAAETINTLEHSQVRLVFGEHADIAVIKPDLIITSPGVPLSIAPLIVAREKGIPIYSEMELAARFTQAPMVVITGTNGKTTTTALIGQIFADAGRKVFVGGNIGVPFISEAAELSKQDVAVLEASSFQLEATYEFKPKAALILNITPDHIDRHGSLEGYIEAKAKIFANQDENDWLILNYDDEETRKLADRTKARVIFFSRRHILEEGFFVDKGILTAKMQGVAIPIVAAEDVYIKGGHNLENALAAAAAGWVMGVGPEVLNESLQTFKGVEHRLERVLIYKGVEYINDSKGTNPDASIKALEAYENPIVLIAGGKSKGSDFYPFALKIKEKAKALVLVGQGAKEIEEAVVKAGYSEYHHAKTFEEAVQKAASLAAVGDIVLLSPACASFDMFNNYEHRGEVFKELVRKFAVD